MGDQSRLGHRRNQRGPDCFGELLLNVLLDFCLASAIYSLTRSEYNNRHLTTFYFLVVNLHSTINHAIIML